MDIPWPDIVLDFFNVLKVGVALRCTCVRVWRARLLLTPTTLMVNTHHPHRAVDYLCA